MACNRECYLRKKELNGRLREWAGKAVLATALEGIAERFADDYGGSTAHINYVETRIRGIAVVGSGDDWEGRWECAMCDEEKAEGSASSSGVTAPPPPSFPNGQRKMPIPPIPTMNGAPPVNPFLNPAMMPFLQTYMMQYEMLAQVYLQSMLAAQQNPLMMGGGRPPFGHPLLRGQAGPQPDWNLLMGMAAAQHAARLGKPMIPPGLLPGFGVNPLLRPPPATPSGPPLKPSASLPSITAPIDKSLAPPPPAKARGNPLDLSRKTGLDTVDVEGVIPRDSPSSAKPIARRVRRAALADESAPGTPTNEEAKLVPSGSSTGYGAKRNYSQIDLDLAVQDIRCGRLGTRRASVVYGIPRSTLRNKIYKLEAADEQAGLSPVYKRRKAGGQSSAEKMIANAVELCTKQKRRLLNSDVTPSPTTNNLSGSPSSVDLNTTSMELNDEDTIPIAAEITLDLSADGETNEEEKDEAGGEDDDPSGKASPDGHDPLAWVTALTTTDWAKTMWSTSATPSLHPDGPRGGSLEPTTAATKSIEERSEGWKKTRAKRGQYRKYDKVALDEAVQSVRRGEMSVHRAGSFYGVPHSTLEYKVKERNLLRSKRKADGGSVSPHSSSGSPPRSEDAHLNQSSRSSHPSFPCGIAEPVM